MVCEMGRGLEKLENRVHRTSCTGKEHREELAKTEGKNAGLFAKL
jgi:hypothetical protein